MGIPTVKREKQNYLIDTLHSLLYKLSEEQKKDCIIIIFIAEVSLRGKVQNADRQNGDLCLSVIVQERLQNTVNLAFGRDFFRARGDGEQLVPQCVSVEKKPVMQMIGGKKSYYIYQQSRWVRFSNKTI